MIWGAFLADGPLLIFITVTMSDKRDLSRMDMFFIVTFFFCLLFGSLIVPQQPYWLAVLWLILSCIFFLPTCYLPYYLDQNVNGSTSPFNASMISNLSSVDSCSDLEMQQQNSMKTVLFSQQHKQTKHLALFLVISFVLFPVNYFIAFLGGYGPEMTVAVYQVLSIATKGMFAASCMDVHLDAMKGVEKALAEEKRANEARRGFMKYIFHEVRSPLNSLTMGIDVLSNSDGLSAADRDTVDMMKGASGFMSDTLNGVLNMQKIEEGKFELDLSPFVLKDSIIKVFYTFRGAANGKNISLVNKMSPIMPIKLIGDRHQIQHVLGNYLSNAIKFSKENSTITVEAVSGQLQNGKVPVTLSVTDSGVGISGENQKMLFSNFFQVRPGQLQQGQGSGLGLSLCKKIVELHGGTVNVESVEGEGSTFSFTIPFREVNHEQSDNKESTDSKCNLTQSSRSMSVGNVSTMSFYNTPITEQSVIALVVDDVISNRKMLAMLLTKRGVVSMLANDGKSALDMVLHNPDAYKLILMDNLMPVMNGVDATRELRRLGYPYLIIGVTGNVMDDDIAEYANAGADMVLSKPLNIPILEKLLAHIHSEGALSQYPKKKLVIDANGSLAWA